MTDSFRDRADLQRRQLYHQQLLESQRFGAREEQGGTQSNSGTRDTSGNSGLLAAAAFLLAIVFLPLTVLSALIALPATLLMLLADRALSGSWGVGFREAFVATSMGVFGYLIATLLVATALWLFKDGGAVLHVLANLSNSRGATAVAIQAPGVLLCATVLCWRIGWPLNGAKGFAVAAAISVAACALSVSLILWSATWVGSG